ncbi:tRNA (N6-threonylcarbamoyladenosine(37)-N6)-methyltransferase TrmO [Rouxiella badensis]|jgi:tRNA-Thr(GGU) m(6)t(6)A37 methyltransferase TsaA|uniref:tRNA (adenine(37)-N6)-methyltransferase n=1 Tax=Rouxiella badensis TaxID=1646377 RepID=A0A1X0WAS0_9GAMM|nr:tRNA (N6-threonylcarbamoyladenosine(37)-N6)-methyltransferase TrmO [Rouxiella badensis]MCC3703700.1 tRNA (N6-threonylcarbamoyladenosine(37)-N6)-methyltransferase TrmO [Rouxiella badensis]MCC3719729.1 tRNA (N6-threonylcarbamoyladenosine(37)-N6)-methyltransferase TrmO [Rouxiella badensis]MCC3729419.1 tRNA (N6-threonylcarbamoyladenosine(37)-N6)-methyltransferase TrmO [Rouxiella badensis]MCC3734836.1 tRNA (N6-threonylcarbamoyladenosine(37)-N6)-methyltransferase TrmO [Rouxiella badensis]MCC37415
MTAFTFNEIGRIHSPYKEKFAVPRQPGLVQDGGGELHLFPPYNQPEAVRGLEEFSHLWVMFIFHQTMEGGWRPTVRPPRLGGNARVGVFATRSTFRPNPLGMSLVELKGIRCQGKEVILELGSLDLVDGTPVVDIKPYLPFAESQPQALAGFAQNAPEANMPVTFSTLAETQLAANLTRYPHLRRFITQVLGQDPRPAYRKGEELERDYAVRLLDFNVRWRVVADQNQVISLDQH